MKMLQFNSFNFLNFSYFEILLFNICSWLGFGSNPMAQIYGNDELNSVTLRWKYSKNTGCINADSYLAGS